MPLSFLACCGIEMGYVILFVATKYDICCIWGKSNAIIGSVSAIRKKCICI